MHRSCRSRGQRTAGQGVTDHQHIYPVGAADPQCHICRERKSAAAVSTPEALAEHSARALALLKSELARIETGGAA